MGPFEDAERPKPATIRIGDDLSTLSVEELEERVAALSGEIERVRAERARKQASRSAADSVFKF